MDDNFELLQEAIKEEFETLSQEKDEEKRKAIVSRIKELYSLRLKELEDRNDYEIRDDDKDIKQKQLDSQRREQNIKLGLTIGSTILSSIFLIGAFKFEEHGTFASWLTKSLFQKNVKIG